MTTLLGWLLTLVIVVTLFGVSIAIPGNTGYPGMGTSPGGAGGTVVVVPTPSPAP